MVIRASDSNSVNSPTSQEEIIPGPLDGMTFSGALGPDGEPKDILDSFVFENGTFVSKECELRCKYPARPYFVRSNGDRTEFISETKCPYNLPIMEMISENRNLYETKKKEYIR